MSVFPETIEQWRCPACGRNLSGKSYNLDEDRARCTKTWHVAAPVKRTYTLTQPVSPQPDPTTRLSRPQARFELECGHTLDLPLSTITAGGDPIELRCPECQPQDEEER